MVAVAVVVVRRAGEVAMVGVAVGLALVIVVASAVA